MKEECYDYFESNNQDDEEPEKEPDVTWDVNNGASSQTIDTSDDEKQEDTQSVVNPEEPEEPKGFWEKIKNILKG